MHTVTDDIRKEQEQADNKGPLSFVEQYICIRKKETRIYSDETLAKLPVVPRSDMHFKEWKLRKKSCNRLLNYLLRKTRTLHILEVGCGNGWLTNRLSELPGAKTTGLDINPVELQQARRVFGENPGRVFIQGDIKSPEIQNRRFDIILFAASLQYFQSPPEIITQAMQKLNEEGEIHIMDTQFYKPGDIMAARKRSEAYFRQWGLPELSGYYFHHGYNSLSKFRTSLMYRPSSWLWLLRNDSPFPWIRITKNEPE